MVEIKRYIALVLVPIMVVFNMPLVAFADEDQPKQPTVNIVHKPVESVHAGDRIVVTAEIEDKNGVDVVRTYFKDEDGENYNFVEMIPSDNASPPIINGKFSAVLPAPNNDANSFTYLILVKNSFNVVVKSQNYWVKVEPRKTASKPVKEPVKVYSELPQFEKKITGFTDNMVFDTVNPDMKFGIVAGLYKTMEKGAENVIYGGTVATAVEDSSNKTVILGTLAVLAVAGGVAALAAGGGGDSSSGSSSGTSGGTCDYEGAWAGTYSQIDCTNLSSQGAWTGSVDANCGFTSTVGMVSFLSGSIDSATGAASLSGTIANCDALSGTATFSTSSVNGSYTGGAEGNFRGTKQ